MRKKIKTPSRLAKAMLETAADMRRTGVIGKLAHDKITLRHLGGKPATPTALITGDEIRALRERAHLSQAVFARYLKLSASYVSKLERGATRPTGPALVLLNFIRRKGIETIP
jgi:putative transcriptional regulator